MWAKLPHFKLLYHQNLACKGNLSHMAKKQNEFEKIKSTIQKVFDAVTEQFLPKDRNSLNIGFDSLPSVYRQAARANGGLPNPETEKDLVEVAEAYLEGAKVRTEARLRNVANTVSSANKAGNEVDLEDLVQEVLDKTGIEVQTTVEAETQRARSMGAFDGLLHVSAKMGIEDPNVIFIVVHDKDLCDECKRLHLLPGGITPRVWKLSQVTHEYHKKGDDRPSMAGEHPHCRCSSSIVPPGFGFNPDGQLTYKYEGYDEYERQQGLSPETD